LAVTDYEDDFTCALGKDNYIGTQFHPEKSGRVGLRLFENFARWDGVWRPDRASTQNGGDDNAE